MEFEQLTLEELEAVKVDWLRLADDHPGDVFKQDYEMVLSQAERIISSPESTSVWAVQREEAVRSLVFLSHALKHSDQPWLKLLQMYLAPDLDFAAGRKELPLNELGLIASTAIVGAWQATYEQYPSDSLKIYGRNPLDISFLEGLLASSALEQYEWKAHTEGNWLIIRTFS